MAFIYQGGKTRRYLNTETNKTISRRQYDKLMKGVNYEKKAAENKKENLVEALARPARGRKKAAGPTEAQIRADAYKEAQEANRIALLERKAKLKKVKVPKIRKQLLTAGHYGKRVGFNTHEEFEDLREQMLSKLLPSGKRLILGYSMGIAGYDSRQVGEVKEIAATLFDLRSPHYDISESEMNDSVDDFLMEHSYFVLANYFVYLKFDLKYAEDKAKAKNKKNIPREHRK